MALVLPVLFLAAMVEMRVSVAAPLLEKEESETQLTLRVAAFVVALSALVLGEAGSSDALWYGAGSGIMAGWRPLAWVSLAWCCCCLSLIGCTPTLMLGGRSRVSGFGGA